MNKIINLCNGIKDVLLRFQDGYKKRDLSVIDTFNEDIFANNKFMSIFGTDEGENFCGRDAGLKLVKVDWQYRGDFDLNTVIHIFR